MFEGLFQPMHLIIILLIVLIIFGRASFRNWEAQSAKQLEGLESNGRSRKKIFGRSEKN